MAKYVIDTSTLSHAIENMRKHFVDSEKYADTHRKDRTRTLIGRLTSSIVARIILLACVERKAECYVPKGVENELLETYKLSYVMPIYSDMWDIWRKIRDIANIRVVDVGDMPVDMQVVQLAKQLGAYVVTGDSRLCREAYSRGVRCIFSTLDGINTVRYVLYTLTT